MPGLIEAALIVTRQLEADEIQHWKSQYKVRYALELFSVCDPVMFKYALYSGAALTC